MTTLLFNFTVKVASQPKFTSPRWAALGSETICFHHSFIFCFTLAAGCLSLSLNMHTVVHNTLEMCEGELKPWSLALTLIWIAPNIILCKFSLTYVVKMHVYSAMTSSLQTKLLINMCKTIRKHWNGKNEFVFKYIETCWKQLWPIGFGTG